jgi:HSP20 family protein
MTQLVRYKNGFEPFSLLAGWPRWSAFRELDRSWPVARRASFAPRFEVKETEDAYVISADLPGVKEEELELTVEDDLLTIAGSRKAEESKEGDSYYVCERHYGAFSRSFRLPEGIDSDKVEADLKDGVLSVNLAKPEAAKPKKIALS